VSIYKQTKDMARSANLLVNKRSGRAGNYGLVLENLLESRGQQFKPALSSQRSSYHPREEVSKSLPAMSGVLAAGASGSLVSGSVVGGSVVREANTAQTSPNRTANTTVHNSRSSSPIN